MKEDLRTKAERGREIDGRTKDERRRYGGQRNSSVTDRQTHIHDIAGETLPDHYSWSLQLNEQYHYTKPYMKLHWQHNITTVSHT